MSAPDEDGVAAELAADRPELPGPDEVGAPEPGTPVYPAQEGVTGGDGGGRFGVYDEGLERFRGGVYGSRKDARKAAKGMGVADPEIRPL